MKVWITGIDGFLGAALCRYLRAQGVEVAGNDSGICSTGLTRFATSRTDCRDRLGMAECLRRIFRPDVLVHAAATAHEGLSTFSPAFVTRNIFEASVATFSAAIAAGVRRVVFCSSMARYGRGEPLGPPFSETFVPSPVDPYGIAKVAAENVLRVLCETHGVAWSILVPHNIIGPGQKYDDPYRNVASIMINRALQNMPLNIYGDGSQVRCFSPVADVLEPLALACKGATDSEIINIGPDEGWITIRSLAERINAQTENKAGLQFLPPRPNEVHAAYCTATKARRLLGFESRQSLDDCLSDMVEFVHATGTRPFAHFAPIEISSPLLPKTWKQH